MRRAQDFARESCCATARAVLCLSQGESYQLTKLNNKSSEIANLIVVCVRDEHSKSTCNINKRLALFKDD